ncbi:MAG: FAD-dependent oxidoreductase [SAR324 cluster bacterium]|nr:FAD-dependent oxidoreductase [SAR324 cluster bacterium]
MQNKNSLKLVLVLFLVGLIGVVFIFDLQQYLTLDYLKAQQQQLVDYYHSNTVFTIVIFFIVYVAATALSIPGAVLLTLFSGALFGLFTGVVIVSFASTLGATLAFLTARFLLRDIVQTRYRDKLEIINKGIQKEGEYYLFTLRLIPAFPFFLINLAMGLTPIGLFKYYFVSQIGMLPGTIVFVFAGTQLSQIDSLQGILSPGLLIAFTFLGLFPLVAKKGVSMINAGRQLKKFKAPKHFDYNVAVIGAGSAGLISAYIAAAVKAKVVLIEKHKMGGDCLNTGCVPSKALIRTAKMLSYANRSQEFGIQQTTVDFDFKQVMERVQSVIKKIEPHDSVERYQELGVDCVRGDALILDPYHVKVEGRIITTRNIIIASGASPFVPPIPGIEKIDYLTSDTLWNIRKLPKRLVVLGGGPIGSEMTQCFARFGSKVSQVEMAPQILIREDEEVTTLVTKRFQKEGVDVLTGHRAKEFLLEGDEKILLCEFEGKDVRIPFDEVIVAVGRRANTKGFGLEELGIEVTRPGTIEHDEYLRTNYPNIFVCGDAAGPYQFTHTAGHQAWYASVNALFRPFKQFRVDYRVIPWCTFTDPEVARVGLNEKDAKEKNIPYETTVFEIKESDRAIADSEDHGFVKVLTVPAKDRILGVTMVGTHAGDLIAEFVLAMKQGLGLNKILGTIHIYPTLVEVNKSAAGNWKKNHVPEKLLKFVEKFHTWRR